MTSFYFPWKIYFTISVHDKTCAHGNKERHNDIRIRKLAQQLRHPRHNKELEPADKLLQDGKEHKKHAGVGIQNLPFLFRTLALGHL